ncbi:MAG: hypothetical protein NTZ10_03790 [Candidatus Saganbacteria bacterium]|nr:hypothetical protein [Candidatus Saganbacteria bacterium]
MTQGQPVNQGSKGLATQLRDAYEQTAQEFLKGNNAGTNVAGAEKTNPAVNSEDVNMLFNKNMTLNVVV